MQAQAEMFDGAVATPPHCCTVCDCDLEEDQVGFCEDCDDQRPREFTELSDKAKNHAREVYTGDGYLDYDWWEFDDLVTCAKLLGVEVDTRDVKLMHGKTRQEPDIRFSGFCSQGDGACFAGSYDCAPNAIKDIAAHAGQDTVLKGIAERLTQVQVLARLKYGETLSAKMTTSSRYSHSGAMNVELMEVECLDSDERDQSFCEAEETIHGCMTDLADWMYAQLEGQHDYLMSDECVDQYLEEEKFDEAGNVL